jgi:2-oxoglutarate ferredoxin oxidoreductase subunit alpha
VRADKIARIADDIPPQAVDAGGDRGRLAVVGWGSTYGPISRAVSDLLARGHDVSHIHLRYLSPLPRNLGALLARFERILVVEMNMGQLLGVLRNQYLVDAEGLNKVAGQPFKIEEVETAILERIQS